MSTQDKMIYLLETKERIRDALLEKGIELPIDAPFRAYAEAVCQITTGADMTAVESYVNEQLEKVLTGYASLDELDQAMQSKASTEDVEALKTNVDAISETADSALALAEDISSGWSRLSSSKPVELIEYDGQAQNCSIGGSTGTFKGFAKIYNLDLIRNACSCKILVAVADAHKNKNLQVTLFAAQFAPSGPNQVYAPLREKTITVNDSGDYVLDLTGLDLSTGDTMAFGYRGTGAFFCNTISTSYISSPFPTMQFIRQYAADSNWIQTSDDVTNYTRVIFSYAADKKPPVDELNQCIRTIADSADSTLRVALISDTHYGATGSAVYGTNNARLQVMVDSLNAEHRKKPFAFALFVGDLVTISTAGIATKVQLLERYVTDFLSKLEMSWFAQRGNHDGYSDADWERIVGNKAQFSIETDAYYFLCIDAYAYSNPRADGKEVFKFSGSDMWYTGMDAQLVWINSELQKAEAKGKKVIATYHTLLSKSDELVAANQVPIDDTWRALLKENPNILCDVLGHSHNPYVTTVNGKLSIGTGSFGGQYESGGKIPTTAGFGYKVLEMQPTQLAVYHLYPALSYPAWKGGSGTTDDPYTTVEYTQPLSTTAPKVVDAVHVLDGATYDLRGLSSNAHMITKLNELEKRLSALEG